MTYTAAMTEARSKIDLKALGIADLKCKRAITGGLILEISGKTPVNSVEKADLLVSQMDGVFKEMGVRVQRSTKCAELRVRGGLCDL